ncbi:hypothetical protein BB561_000918 [Smittium simulii]|uniref:Type 1 phosphatases regulator n=1 Tax=Smittium simulii TaxID=133385 RepID=A0A2T9YWU2_9FUNG|nr:hypothetical protein BB561_000918 [Smittium simulii]
MTLLYNTDTSSADQTANSPYSLGALVSQNHPPQTAQRTRGVNRAMVSTQTQFSSPNQPSSGSLTSTSQIPAAERSASEGVLLLRGESFTAAQSDKGKKKSAVRWTTDTVDNEHLGKKKSKICCVFKKVRSWSDSESDESDCSSCDDHDHPNEYERP